LQALLPASRSTLLSASEATGSEGFRLPADEETPVVSALPSAVLDTTGAFPAVVPSLGGESVVSAALAPPAMTNAPAARMMGAASVASAASAAILRCREKSLVSAALAPAAELTE
jgi:hypothetical protein